MTPQDAFQSSLTPLVFIGGGVLLVGIIVAIGVLVALAVSRRRDD